MSRQVIIGGPKVVPLVFRMLGSFGIFLIYYYLFNYTTELVFIMLGIAISPAVMMLWMSRKAREINLDKKYLWDFTYILGSRWGKKASLPDASHLMLKRSKDGLFLVLQLVHGSKKTMLLWDEDPEKARKKAMTVSKKLNLPLENDLSADNPETSNKK
jgi:hypothetical protein